MLWFLPTVTVHEVPHWFNKRFKGEYRASEAWKVLRFVVLKKPDAKLEKCLRGFRTIAFLNVFSLPQLWWTHCTRKKEPIEWRSSHVGAERGAICQHMQALVTNIFQRHWEWQEDRRTNLQPGLYRYNMAFMTSSDVKTALDVAKPSVVSKNLTLTEVHGHPTAALLAEMQDVRRSACFENSETEFRYKVRPPRGGKGSGLVGMRCHLHTMESPKVMARQLLGTTFLAENMTLSTCCGDDVGRQLLAILRQ